METDTKTAALVESHLLALSEQIPGDGPRDTRDWSGFFAALIAMAKELLPIILPLLVTPKSDQPKK